MKKAFFVLFFVAVFCCVAVCSTNYFFCDAQDEQSATRVLQIVTELEGLDPLYCSKGYSLINEADYLLIEEGTAALCGQELLDRYYANKLAYYKADASNIVEGYFSGYDCILVINDRQWHYTEQDWAKIILLKAQVLADIQAETDIKHLSSLTQVFYQDISAVLTLEYTNSILEDFAEKWVAELDMAVVDKVNSSLSILKPNKITTLYAYRRSTSVQGYNDWFKELLFGVYSPEDTEEIIAFHQEAIDQICALPYGTENCDSIVSAFSLRLNEYQTQKNNINEYLLLASKEAAKTRLSTLCEGDDFDKANPKAKNTIRLLVDEALLKLEGATTVSEVNTLLDAAENAVSEVDVRSYSWVWLCVAAAVILAGFIVFLVLYARKKRREEGKAKLALLLEDERERVEKETDSPLSTAEQAAQADTDNTLSINNPKDIDDNKEI